MKLIRSTEFSKIWCFKHSKVRWTNWVFVRYIPRMEWHLLCNFLILNNTLSWIIRESSWVKIKHEAMRLGAFNLVGTCTIYFSHSFDFYKFNMVSILENMAFIFMNSDSRFLTLLDHCNNKALSLFSIVVGNGMIISKINKSISPWSQSRRWDITSSLGSAEIIQDWWVLVDSSQEKFSLANQMNLTTFNCCM